MNFLIGFQSNHSTENKLRALTGNWATRLGNKNATLALEIFCTSIMKTFLAPTHFVTT